MKTTLLIGNGLNLTLSDDSWKNVVKKIAEERNIQSLDSMSLPLEFERVMNIHLQNNPKLKNKSDAYSTAKSRMANDLRTKQLPPDSIHYLLRDIPVDNIVTTNYDYLLERVFDSGFIPEKSTDMYLDEFRSEIAGVKFYHAHGEANNTRSICLGYEHYAKLLSRIRRNIDQKEGNSRVILRDLRFKVERDCWYYKFFSDNVYIVGLGLGESEIDLWSLLTKRASLYYRDCEGARSIIRNRIIYFDVLDDIDGNVKSQTNKHELLEGAHVEVVTESLSSWMGKCVWETMDNEEKKKRKNAAYVEAYKAFLRNIPRENKEYGELEEDEEYGEVDISEIFSLADV